jgi:acetyl-CoA synthetase
VTLDTPADRDRIPYPGFAIVDDDGHPVPNGTPGEWTMRHPWPGTMRTVQAQGDDPTAYHWSRHPGRYASGDRARRTPAGQVEFLGRVDEVVSVSGQLVSLNEVRDALVEQPFVADAEVVERLDRRLGRSVAAAIVLHPDAPSDPVTIRELQDAVRELLGGLSRPRAMLVVDRFGSELDQPTRRRALAVLAASVEDVTAHVTWAQVLAAAGH